MSTTTERVGRYQLLEPIGTGPCGSVWRAKVFGVAGFERQFAVKRFHPELTITTALAQGLSAAARAYGSLEHPRIARMTEFGVAQGTTFTAVEYVAGLDAARLIAEARLAGLTLAAGGALALVSQAARAVGYAHGRGLSHLGLAPTNVIVTADGDIKISDFGVLAAGMPQRPIDVARLAQRIQYLAPEQIANEATSAATDVFALGVIAYELVTGQRTFRGETPQQVAQSIMQGLPPEPPLPRPIVRVLQRCLARSPFERFPDARALADALDAALRVAPVPGTRKDIGAQVKAIVERLAALNESEMSGMVALHVGTGPVARVTDPDIATLGRESLVDVELPTTELERRPSELAASPASTLPELPRSTSTLTGLAPPPIPVPQGVGGQAAGTPPRPPGSPATLLGIPKIPSVIPPIKAPKSTDPGTGGTARSPAARPGPIAARPAPPAARPPSVPPPPPPGAERLESVLEMQIEESSPAEPPEPLLGDSSGTMPGVLPAPTHSSDRDEPTTEMSPLLGEKLSAASRHGTAEISPLVQTALDAEANLEIPVEDAAAAPPVDDTPVEVPDEPPPARPDTEGVLIAPAPGAAARAETEGVLIAPAPASKPTTSAPQLPPARRSRAPLIAGLVVLGAGGVGVGAWQLYERMQADDATTSPPTNGGGNLATVPADAAPTRRLDDAAVATTADAGGATTIDAPGPVAVVDAGAAAPADAGAVVAVTPGDDLVITSTPKGAHVYLDGADAGTTPIKLPGSPDRHTVALLLPGYDLRTAEVAGSGTFDFPLIEVTPSGGPAGIKVIRCKDKDRYYVFVDGKPTGMMCPTERIETDLGPHTVEVYDAVTETRKSYDIVIKDTRLSHRVKIE